VYDAVARTPTPELDRPVRRLSDAANNSRLWLGIAAAIALAGGGRGRRAALEGVVAIGVTSATVNLGVKPLASRRRPDPTVAAACDRLPQRQHGERAEPEHDDTLDPSTSPDPRGNVSHSQDRSR